MFSCIPCVADVGAGADQATNQDASKHLGGREGKQQTMKTNTKQGASFTTWARYTGLSGNMCQSSAVILLALCPFLCNLYAGPLQRMKVAFASTAASYAFNGLVYIKTVQVHCTTVHRIELCGLRSGSLLLLLTVVMQYVEASFLQHQQVKIWLRKVRRKQATHMHPLTQQGVPPLTTRRVKVSLYHTVFAVCLCTPVYYTCTVCTCVYIIVVCLCVIH